MRLVECYKCFIRIIYIRKFKK